MNSDDDGLNTWECEDVFNEVGHPCNMDGSWEPEPESDMCPPEEEIAVPAVESTTTAGRPHPQQKQAWTPAKNRCPHSVSRHW